MNSEDERVESQGPPYGRQRVRMPSECGVCGNSFGASGWHLTHGEVHCVSCGADYQIKPLSGESWEDVPRHKVTEEFVEPIKEFHEETGNNVREDNESFRKWVKEKYPELWNDYDR